MVPDAATGRSDCAESYGERGGCQGSEVRQHGSPAHLAAGARARYAFAARPRTSESAPYLATFAGIIIMRKAPRLTAAILLAIPSFALPAFANHGPGASGGRSFTISGETLKGGHFELSL